MEPVACGHGRHAGLAYAELCSLLQHLEASTYFGYLWLNPSLHTPVGLRFQELRVMSRMERAIALSFLPSLRRCPKDSSAPSSLPALLFGSGSLAGTLLEDYPHRGDTAY